VLLVDDTEAKIFKRNALVKQRVRPNENIGDFIARDEWQTTFLVAVGRPKRDIDSKWFQPAA